MKREEIYRERRSLEEFGVDESGTMSHALFNSIIETDFLMPWDNAESVTLGLFNDAYYICTLILLEKRPYFNISSYEDIASGEYQYYPNDREIIVLSMVSSYLKSLDFITDDVERTINMINKRCSGLDGEIYEKITSSCEFALSTPATSFLPLMYPKEEECGYFWKSQSNFPLAVIDAIDKVFSKKENSIVQDVEEKENLQLKNNNQAPHINKSDNNTNDLKEELQAYKEKNKHIDAGPAAAIFLAIAQMTEGNNGNNVNKQKLALAVSRIFGFNVAEDGRGYIRNLMCGSNGGITDAHKEKIAQIIEDAMPNLAAKIRKL